MRTAQWVCGLALLAACGCSGMNNTDRGMVGGGLIGAGVGTVVGGLVGHPGVGAAIGGGAGALTGAAVGSAHDKADQRAAQAAYATAVRNPPLSITNVVELAQRNTPDEVIINQMDTTGSVYQLTAADIAYLQDNRVSPRVIMAMQNRTTARPVVAVPRHVYVYEPPPPPVAVGVGFGFSSGPGYRRCR